MKNRHPDISMLLEAAQLNIRAKIRIKKLVSISLKMKRDNPEVKNKEDKRLLQDKLRMNEMELKEAEEALHNFERIKSQWLADLVSEAEVRQRLSNMGYL